jgi:pimeloyl-ACP methyl ester carboxylesterase
VADRSEVEENVAVNALRSRTSRHRDVVSIEHRLDVPLDHHAPDGERIEVFARELVKVDKANDDLPRLLYLQGGPGGKSPRPSWSAWVERILRDYRVVLLDQRGTGLSTPANRQTLARRGGPEEQADYLQYFRADAIVRDSELLRAALNGDQPWSLLGQSFGGFCTMTYLSFAPHGVKEAFVTGGIPPIQGTADDVYRVTYDRCVEKNEAYFRLYPEDRELCARIVRQLAEKDVRLPTGERFSPRRFQTVGHGLGMREEFDGLHYVLEEAFVPGSEGEEISDTFLHAVGSGLSYAEGPLYALLHEPIYQQGTASRWSAERIYAEREEFHLDRGRPFLFTGEMIYPFFFDEDPALVPLRETANLLADKEDWPALYDVDQLARNEIPVFAAIYYNDLYVAREHSLATVQAVPKITPLITNEFEHDGIRAGDVLDRLFKLAKETP